MYKYIPARYVYISFAFFATFNLYALRLNLSVAIVDMVHFEKNIPNQNTTTHVRKENTSLSQDSRVNVNANESDKFSWNGNQQGLLLSSYYYGYIVTQVLGAFLGRKYGRVRVLGICTIGSSVITLLFPVITKNLGFPAAVFLRILLGLLSGVTMPTLYGTTSVWAPVSERSKLIAMQYAGIPTGSFVVLPIAGLLAHAYGWEAVFYATGGFGLAWASFWLIFIYETPEEHPRISTKEKHTIMGSTVELEIEKRTKRPVPWISILTSRAWACLAFTHFASLFGKYQLMSMLPSYLKTVLNFDVKASGMLSSIPFILATVLLFLVGPGADYLIARHFKSIHVRKALTTIGLLTSSVSIIIVTYIGNNIVGAMVLFTLSVAMDSLVVPGFKSCIMEITPEFSGIAYGMSNTISTLSGIIAPQITGTLRDSFSEDIMKGWRVSFWIGGAIYFLGAVVFLVFGTNKKQPWSYEDTDNKKEISLLNQPA